MKLHNLFEIWIEDIFWDRYLCLQPTKKPDYINETLRVIFNLIFLNMCYVPISSSF